MWKFRFYSISFKILRHSEKIKNEEVQKRAFFTKKLLDSATFRPNCSFCLGGRNPRPQKRLKLRSPPLLSILNQELRKIDGKLMKSEARAPKSSLINSDGPALGTADLRLRGAPNPQSPLSVSFPRKYENFVG